MGKITLKGICILALVGIAIGLIICLLNGEFSIGVVIFTALAVLGIGLGGEEGGTENVLPPSTNSAVYNTDIATGKLITELQKLNKK